MHDKELIYAKYLSIDKDNEERDLKRKEKGEKIDDKKKEKEEKDNKRRRRQKAEQLDGCDSVIKVKNMFLRSYKECGSLNFTALRKDGFIKNITHVDKVLWESPKEDEAGKEG